MMWQSHTQYIHVPSWNKMPAGQFGDTGISFGHAVSTDLAHWTQVRHGRYEPLSAHLHRHLLNYSYHHAYF